MNLWSSFGGARDIAIDLGTANTLVYVQDRGIVLAESSVVAIDALSGEVHAVGSEAKRMIGRTPATISATRPLRHGVIADFEVTEQMLRYFIRSVGQNRFAHPRVVMCVPSGVTSVEKRAVEEACLSAGARRVQLIEESIAAAIGSGLRIEEPRGNIVVDVGGGTSEVAVISLGDIVVSRSLRIGGYEFDEAILNHLRRRHNMAIGQQAAEDLKIAIGSGHALVEELEEVVTGRDLVSGLPKKVTLTSQEIRASFEEPLRAIMEAVRDTLEETPPELAADLVQRGILLAGGGCLLRGLDERLREETEIPTRMADSPLTCVALGAGQSLERFEALEQRVGQGRVRR